MEIRIDTSKDSKEDIRGMIRFLQEFIEKTEPSQSLTVPVLKDELLFDDRVQQKNLFDKPKETFGVQPKIEFF